jgi:ferredoxin
VDGIEVSFPGTPFPAVHLARHQFLSECLTVENSPILFGCRTGICGTCLVQVQGDASVMGAEEAEVVEILAPHLPHARLACQLQALGPLQIKIPEAGHEI